MARLPEGHITAEKIQENQNPFKIPNFTKRKNHEELSLYK